MADLKISALTASTTPLAGTEVLPIVQSGATKQVSVANLTAGRTQTSNGIVQGTAATGYNFTANTPASGMTSQLLNWYEEGTWTPAAATWSVAPTFDFATYTRVGRLVTLSVVAHGGTCVAGSTITGLPFTCSSSSGGSVVATSDLSAVAFTGAIYNNATSITKISASTIAGSVYWTFSCSYFA